MITSLVIKNYALIDNLNIDLEKGFSIITGETGAGKSIILGAMSLILGQRADTSVINDNSQKCIVEAIFDVKNYNIKKFFNDNEIDYFKKTIIRREISPEGRSRAFINDTPVNLSALKKITENLIDIHSQHDSLELNKSSFQTEAIDLFSNNSQTLKKYQQNFNKFKKLNTELSDLQEKANKQKADSDYYQFQFDQINKANLNENEQEELEKEQKKLSHTEEIKSNLSKINFLLENDEHSTIGMLKDAAKSAENILNYLPKAQEISDRLESALIDLQDLANESEVINNDLELDPERLEFINSRLDTIYNLQHKFNVSSVKELLKIKNDFSDKIDQISSFDEKIVQKKIEIKNIKQKLVKLANQLHKKRTENKKPFENKIVSLLENLGIPNAKFTVEINKIDNFTSLGTDAVLFLFSANKNSQQQPVNKIASGGELSRLMLSIKYIISKSKTLPTIIFDEIDTGVSGEIAAKMGILLKKMSENLQIINITHLPQIAAKGNNHFLVYKKEKSDKTNTQIYKLNYKQRINEIAKMLSGTNITKSAIENAKELLNN